MYPEAEKKASMGNPRWWSEHLGVYTKVLWGKTKAPGMESPVRATDALARSAGAPAGTLREPGNEKAENGTAGAYPYSRFETDDRAGQPTDEGEDEKKSLTPKINSETM